MDGDWDGKVQRTDDKEDILGTALSSTRSTRRGGHGRNGVEQERQDKVQSRTRCKV